MSLLIPDIFAKGVEFGRYLGDHLSDLVVTVWVTIALSLLIKAVISPGRDKEKSE